MKSGWADEIDRLMEQGYRFLDATYNRGGVLFRGMSSGAAAAIDAGVCAHFSDSSPQCQFEQEIGVFFCSQDISDAISISRIWENRDSAIMFFPADLFIQEWNAKKSAVMALAEAGIVFRYPFLLRPLTLSELSIVVRPHQSFAASCVCEQVELPKEIEGDRTACDSAVRSLLDARGYKAATLQYGVEYPVRCSEKTAPPKDL